MNQNNVNIWESGIDVPDSRPPQPLLSMPVMAPPAPLMHHPPPPFNSGVPPPYAGITSPIFTKQVPPNCLPNLRFPPPTPPYHGQPIWNPYLLQPYAPKFGFIFEYLLAEGGAKAEVKAALKEFRKMPLNEQFQQFFFARTLSAEQIRLRWQLVLDILFLLRLEFPVCEVHAFGSVITGLGDMSSDIDIFIDILGPFAPFPLPALEALHRTNRYFKKIKCPHTGRRFLGGHTVPVTHARVPVLKMKHGGSGLSFDLTFQNRVAVQNSRLLVLYTNMDPRVFRFMVLIRYWLKYHQLSGPNDIKNYALTLLVLVFLMKKGIVPPVHLLQRLQEEHRKEQNEPLNPDEIDGWDASFCETPEPLSHHFKATPVPPDFEENPTLHLIKLAVEFFKMYAHTDLSAVVICPLLGDIVLKGGFLPGNEPFLTDILARYKKFCGENDASSRLKLNAPMCIQDPFVLNYNVTSAAPLATILKFQIACAKTVDVISTKLEASPEQLSLLDLFTPLPTHLNSKDFMKSVRADSRKRNCKKEILRAFGMAPTSPSENSGKDAQNTEQRNKYTKLPRHLASLDRLLDPDDYLAWQKSSTPLEFVQVAMNKPFNEKFMSEVARCQLIKNDSDFFVERLKLTKKLVSLWKAFALDFTKEFLEEGLKLKIVGEVKTASVPMEDVDVDDIWGIDQHHLLKISIPHIVNGKSDEVKAKFEKKVDDIDETEGENQSFRMMSVEIPYPFWNRQLTLPEWKEGKMKTVSKDGKVDYLDNPVKVEGLISEKLLQGFQAKMGRQENLKEKENVEEDADGEVEEEQSKKKKRRVDNGKFSPFKVDVLLKLATKLGGKPGMAPKDILDSLERPTMSIILQSDTNVTYYKAATSKLFSLLQTVFPEYQVHRLRDWIKS